MSMPVVLAIVLNVQTTLQGIARASGYNYDVKAASVVIDPEPLEAIPPTELPYIVVGDVTPGARSFKTSRPVAIQDTFTISLTARVDAPGNATDRARKETAGWQLVQDVERALAINPQRGVDAAGNPRALYTYVQQPTVYPGIGGQNQVYVEIPVEITIQRAYGAP